MTPAPTNGLSISVHGPGADLDSVIEAGVAMKGLLAAVTDEMGVEGVEWKIGAVYFKCDGCDLRLPDRPGPDEGWTHDAGDDFCPACTEARTA